MPDHSLDVLVVDDEAVLREVLALRLVGWGHRVRTAGNASEADLALRTAPCDLVLSDVVMPGLSGLELLRVLKAHDPELPFVLMTSHGHVDAAVEAMKEGALDFLTKPLDYDALHSLLLAVSAERYQRHSDRALDATLCDGLASLLIGESRLMEQVRRQVAQVAASDASALILGESGTGKEVVARAVHSSSVRAKEAFVAVNAAAIPEGLVEAEVFGHEAGAFTGALRARSGCFEQAKGGTLFLDEIAEMPISLQPKLLRVLEDGRIRRLGGVKEVALDVRVLAATNRALGTAVADGRLREDLLYRLNVFEIVLPPLRERLKDIPLLVRHFLKGFNAKHGASVEGLRATTLDVLAAWHWPGNVRELRNVIERAVVVVRDGWVEPAHLPPYVRRPTPGGARPIILPPNSTLADAERFLVLETLERSNQNKAEAARRLGLDVKTIRNKLRQWGIA
jgi:DNA-binding NtrC family response regulator